MCTLASVKLDGSVSSTLFVQPNDTLQEIWTGRRPGVEGSRTLAVDDVLSNNNFVELSKQYS